jgi:hypothetical protein
MKRRDNLKKFSNFNAIFVAKQNFSFVLAVTHHMPENLALLLHGDFSMDSFSVESLTATQR